MKGFRAGGGIELRFRESRDKGVEKIKVEKVEGLSSSLSV